MVRRYLEPGEQLDERHVRSVAEQTRADFDAGKIAAEYILELLSKPGASFFSVPSLDDIKRGLEDFPEGHCREATLVLVDRLQLGKKVDGSFDTEEERPHTLHWLLSTGGPSTIHKAHSFWVAQVNPLSAGYEYERHKPVTIADITADQFPNVSQRVYVGPLRAPWLQEGVTIEDIDPDLGY